MKINAKTRERLEKTRMVLCRKIKTVTGDELRDARKELENIEKIIKCNEL